MNHRLRKKVRRGEYAPAPLTAWQRISAELTRQRVGEGYSEAHDDAHRDGALERAADAYALPVGLRGRLPDADHLPVMWPWEARFWKPTPHDRDRELVKAGALYEAEIQRLTRIEAGLIHGADGQRLKFPSVGGLLASKLGPAFERLEAKQALLETELNRRALERRLPTQASGPYQPAPTLATVLRALNGWGRAVQGPRGTWHADCQRPWFVQLTPMAGGHELVVAIWEYPHLYDFDARWQFDEAGRLTDYRATQATPRPPVFDAAGLYRQGPSGSFLASVPSWK